MSSVSPASLYAAALAERGAGFELRPEIEADTPFLRDLFIACAPLKGVLPAAMMVLQADTQAASHRSRYPDAMRRIVVRCASPVGRIVLDWNEPGETRCVDIAMLPGAQGHGLGSALLGAWLDLADRLRRTARLSVLRDNPALQLYTRLGFRAVAADDGVHPFVAMERPRVAIAG